MSDCVNCSVRFIENWRTSGISKTRIKLCPKHAMVDEYIAALSQIANETTEPWICQIAATALAKAEPQP